MASWQPSSRYLKHLSRQWRRLVTAYSLSSLLVLLALALPWPLKYLIDNVLVGDVGPSFLANLSAAEQVFVLATAMLALGVTNALVLSNERVVHARLREQFDFGLRDEILQRLHTMHRFNRQTQRSGELALRLTSDTQHVSRLFCKTLPTIFKHSATVMFTLITMSLIDYRLGGLAAVLALVLAAVVMRFGPAVSKAARTKRHLEGKVAAFSQETIAGIEHVQSMGLEASNRTRYLDHASASLEAGIGEVRVAVRIERMTQIIAAAALAAIAGLGGVLVLNDQLTLGTLTVCLAYTTALLKPIEKINELVVAVTRAQARLERLEAVFRPDIHEDPAPGSGDSVPEVITALEARGLTYQYPDADQPSICDFSHHFVRGEATVIIGPSGSGKSTVLRLLLQFLKPTAGVLVANGSPISVFDKSEYRSKFAVVLQDSYLFAGSVRNVLSELAPDATEADMYRVLDNVALSEQIRALPMGLDSSVDEIGSQLSGGQRTRLLLARALLGQRSVLILDEPFANIDDVSKHIICGHLQKYKRHCILIVITHEHTLLQLADHVLDAECWRSEQTLGAAHV